MSASRDGARTSPRPSLELASLRQVKGADYAVRFALGAGISITAGVVGDVFGAHAGGLFLAFPAILPASLTLIQEKEGTRKANRNAYGATLGAVGLVAFAVVVTIGLDRYPAPAVLTAALAMWLTVSVGAYAAVCLIRPEVCQEDRH